MENEKEVKHLSIKDITKNIDLDLGDKEELRPELIKKILYLLSPSNLVQSTEVAKNLEAKIIEFKDGSNMDEDNAIYMKNIYRIQRLHREAKRQSATIKEKDFLEYRQAFDLEDVVPASCPEGVAGDLVRRNRIQNALIKTSPRMRRLNIISVMLLKKAMEDLMEEHTNFGTFLTARSTEIFDFCPFNKIDVLSIDELELAMNKNCVSEIRSPDTAYVSSFNRANLSIDELHGSVTDLIVSFGESEQSEMSEDMSTKIFQLYNRVLKERKIIFTHTHMLLDKEFCDYAYNTISDLNASCL